MHEVAHQWFGDLVSIKYWNSLWLNEGFARFIDYLIYIDFPNEDKKVDFFRRKMALSCLQYFENSVEEMIVVSFDELFTFLVYNKGSFVLKMFSDKISMNQNFEVCLKWLIQFKNKATDIYEFVSFINNELGQDFRQFFDSWLRKSSFPVVMVKEIDHDEKNREIQGSVNFAGESKQRSFSSFSVLWLTEMATNLKQKKSR